MDTNSKTAPLKPTVPSIQVPANLEKELAESEPTPNQLQSSVHSIHPSIHCRENGSKDLNISAEHSSVPIISITPFELAPDAEDKNDSSRKKSNEFDQKSRLTTLIKNTEKRLDNVIQEQNEEELTLYEKIKKMQNTEKRRRFSFTNNMQGKQENESHEIKSARYERNESKNEFVDWKNMKMLDKIKVPGAIEMTPGGKVSVSPHKQLLEERKKKLQRSKSLWKKATRLVLDKLNFSFTEQEAALFKINIYSYLGTIVIFGLLYFNYLLLGDFFTCIFLAIIISIGLRPTKDLIIEKIKQTCHGKNGSYFQHSIIYKTYCNVSYIWKIVYEKNPFRSQKSLHVKQNKNEKCESHSNSLNIPEGPSCKRMSTFFYAKKVYEEYPSILVMIKKEIKKAILATFNDIYFLSTICLFYICLCKVLYPFGYIILISIAVLDLIIRLIFDFIILIMRKLKLIQYIIDFSSGDPHLYVHSLTATILIITAAIIGFILFVFGFFALIIDLQQLAELFSWGFQKLAVTHFFNEILEEEMIFKAIRYAFSTYENSLKDLQLDLNLPILINGTNEEILKELTILLNNALEMNQTMNSTDVFSISEPINSQKTLWDVIGSFFGQETFSSFFWKMTPFFSAHSSTILIFLSNTFSAIYSFGFTLLHVFASTIAYYFLQISMEIANLIFMTIVFLTCLFYFLQNQTNLISKSLRILPIKKTTKDTIERSLIRSIEGVFLSSIKILIYHSIFTWLVFDIFNVKFRNIYTLVSGIITILPVLSPWMLAIPAALELYLFQDKTIGAVLFFLIYVSIISYVDTLIYKKISSKTHPYILGMSLILGLYAFGVLGVIYGPLLVCTSIVIYEVCIPN